MAIRPSLCSYIGTLVPEYIFLGHRDPKYPYTLNPYGTPKGTLYTLGHMDPQVSGSRVYGPDSESFQVNVGAEVIGRLNIARKCPLRGDREEDFGCRMCTLKP